MGDGGGGLRVWFETVFFGVGGMTGNLVLIIPPALLRLELRGRAVRQGVAKAG